MLSAQSIAKGLDQSFMKINVVERTNKAEIRQEEQSEKAGCGRGEFME